MLLFVSLIKMKMLGGHRTFSRTLTMMDVLISRFLSLLAILWWKQIETFIDIQIVKRISHD